MARAHLRYVITDSQGSAISNAAVYVYQPVLCEGDRASGDHR